MGTETCEGKIGLKHNWDRFYSHISLKGVSFDLLLNLFLAWAGIYFVIKLVIMKALLS